MWVKMNELTVGQEITGIRDGKSIYCCQGMWVSALGEHSITIRHPHGDTEYIEDVETEFRIKEK